jgi:hypothetical protein
MPQLAIQLAAAIPDRLRPILTAAPLPALDAGSLHAETARAIESLGGTASQDEAESPDSTAHQERRSPIPPDQRSQPPLNAQHASQHASPLNEAVLAGLWLLAGDLDRSHAFSQEIPTPTGSFWHGIMHRREGDYENAKYWFRRVGRHPLLAAMAAHVPLLRAEHSNLTDLPWEELADPKQLPFTLVDACRAAGRGRSPWREPLRQLCWLEWQLLLIDSLTD